MHYVIHLGNSPPQNNRETTLDNILQGIRNVLMWGKNLYFQHGDRRQKASLVIMFRARRAKKKKISPTDASLQYLVYCMLLCQRMEHRKEKSNLKAIKPDKDILCYGIGWEDGGRVLVTAGRACFPK